MDWACIAPHSAGVVLRIRVAPNAAQTQAVGLTIDAGGTARLAVRVKAPPVEGKANRVVVRWAAQVFNTRPNRVTVLRGDRGREKDLLLEGLDEAGVARALEQLLNPPQ